MPVKIFTGIFISAFLPDLNLTGFENLLGLARIHFYCSSIGLLFFLAPSFTLSSILFLISAGF